MDKDIEKLKVEMRKKRHNDSNIQKKHFDLYPFFMKLLIIIVLTISTLIVLKKYPKFKEKFYSEVYESNISFAKINYLYKNLFGSPIPFSEYLESKTTPVFFEKLKYYEKRDYKDGVCLTVDKNYLVPTIESGMVVFIGDKENYPNTVIIEQVNGIDVWYSNIENININLYDYIDKGQMLGSTIGSELYIVYKKNGEVLDYNEYI